MSITYNEIQALYLGLLDRPANASGEDFWYSQTGSASSIANTIGTYAKYSPTDNGQSLTAITSSNITNEITNIYTNLLGFTPSAGNTGVAYWAGLYTAGTLSIGQIVDSIFNIVENLTSGSPHIDEKTYMNNAIATATSYTQANANVTYNAAAYLAEGQTIIATPVTTPYNLTTGIDSLTPTGNSTINGVIGTLGLSDPATTFNALDSIKATGTNNTLNIADQDNASALPFPTVTVSGVQTTNIQAVGGVAVNTSSWTGLTQLNLTASTGADNVTAAGTTAVSVNDTLATGTTGTIASTTAATTILGGSTVNLTATGANSSLDNYIGDITVGSSSTAPTGAVSVTATETLTGTGDAGAITVNGGTTQTINSTVNAGCNTTGSTITASSAAGAVVINNNTVVTDTTNTSNQTITGDAVTVSGGSTITINDVITATNAANLATNISGTGYTINANDGTVSVTSITATAVTVNQTATNAVAATAAVLASGGVVTNGGPGYDSSTTPVVAAAAAIPGVVGVTAGDVAIGGAGFTTVGTTASLANASSTITSVTLANYSDAAINSTVLNNLTLSGTGADLTVDNVGTSPVTTLALNLNAFTASGAIIEPDITTLNVTTGGATASTLDAFTDTSLTTLNVAGTQTLAFTSIPSSLTTINISGAAGLNANISAYLTASAPTITDNSSGQVALTMDASSSAQQTFVGSSGQDIITIASDATKAITGGSASDNELVLNASATTFLSGTGHTWAEVTGFSILGLGAKSEGTYNLGAMGSNVFNAIEVMAAPAAATTFTNVAHDASLSIDASINAFTDALNYQAANATGASDVVTVNLGTSTGNVITVGYSTDTASTTSNYSLMMQDANNVGIGTLNIVSNGNASGDTNVNIIVALADSGLSHLNVSGVDGLDINYLNEGASYGTTPTAATSFNINNTSGGAVTIGTLTDSALGAVTFTGTGNDAITNLAGLSGHVLSITNTGTGTASIGTISASGLNSLNSLTLGAGVALGPDSSTLANYATQGLQDASTAGVTVAGSADNAHVVVTLTEGAAAGNTDSITLGNANDYVFDASTAGTVNVTVGTGSNLIVLGTTSDTTGSYAVTLGAHTPTSSLYDSISVGAQIVSSGSYLPTAANLVVTGAVGYSATAGDVINFNADNIVASSGSTTQMSGVSATLTVLAPITASSTLAPTISALESAVSTHADYVAFSVFDGNTYVAEANNGTAASDTNQSAITLIELVGTHTFAASTTANHLVVI
jgi:S-layer protein